jgi:protein gp37
MADKSRIEWTDATWNPTTGCDQVSPGCDHCYAKELAARLKAAGSRRYQNDGNPVTSGPGFGLTLHPETLDLPRRWTRPRRIFVNSMSDLFHERIPFDFLREVFRVMEDTPQHTYQILTKRATHLTRLASRLPWPENVWMGVSVENQTQAERRIPKLLQVPAAVRFLSCEPLLGEVNLRPYLSDLQWVIVGGESGPDFRDVQEAWVRDIRDACIANQVPFFFKQWGGRTPKSGGRTLDGRTWDEYPVASVRQVA